MAMTCYTDWEFVRAGNYDKAKGLPTEIDLAFPDREIEFHGR
jgi:hypothetical protein